MAATQKNIDELKESLGNSKMPNVVRKSINKKIEALEGNKIIHK